MEKHYHGALSKSVKSANKRSGEYYPLIVVEETVILSSPSSSSSSRNRFQSSPRNGFCPNGLWLIFSQEIQNMFCAIFWQNWLQWDLSHEKCRIFLVNAGKMLGKVNGSVLLNSHHSQPQSPFYPHYHHILIIVITLVPLSHRQQTSHHCHGHHMLNSSNFKWLYFPVINLVVNNNVMLPLVA